MSIRILPLILALSASGTASAADTLPEEVASAACSKAAGQLADRWGSKGAWQRQTDPASDAMSFRTPTQQFGVWLEIQRHPGAAPILMRLTENGTTHVEFAKADCAPTLSVLPGTLRHEPLPWLGDVELEAMMKKNPKGILYLWSPRYAHSLTAFTELKAAAEKVGVPVFSAMDPASPADLTKSTSAKAKAQGLDSKTFSAMELFARNVSGHYPKTIVFHQGLIAGQPIVGANSTEFYAQAIQNRLSIKE